MFQKVKRDDSFNVFHLTLYAQNIAISTYNQYKSY